jgi:hypothetical protein
MDQVASRQADNAVDQRFRICFAERLYDGAPRWYGTDYLDHAKTLDPDCTIDREPTVRSKLYASHDPRLLYHSDNTGYFATCVNPDCPARFQELLAESDLSQLDDDAAKDKRSRRSESLKNLALGKGKEHGWPCPSCGQPTMVFAAEIITDKWVYVLKEVGGSLAHYCEIHVDVTGGGGVVYTAMAGGVYDRAAKYQAYPGYLLLLPDPTQFAWHFFLSPVPLGKAALAMLQQSAQKQADLASVRDAKSPANAGVFIDPALQPWAATVRRKFSAKQAANPARELIPLVDPFAWAAQVVELDYVPILGTQMQMLGDGDEQAKAFIATVLTQVVGQRKTGDNPPTYENDPWDVKDELRPIPPGGSGTSVADAWLNRYKAAATYLTKEISCACSRLSFLLRFSLAHRIVEMGCQDWPNENDPLQIGIMHWSHILRDVLLCREGQDLVAALTAVSPVGSDASPMRPQDRIPVRNVLHGEGLGGAGGVAEEMGLGPVVNILAVMAGPIAAQVDDPYQYLTDTFKKVGVPVEATADGLISKSTFLSVRDLSLKVSGDVLKKYISKFPATPDEAQVQQKFRAEKWDGVISVFGSTKDVEKAFSIICAIADITKSPPPTANGYQRWSNYQSRIKAPLDAVDFIGKQGRALAKANANGKLAALMGKIDKAPQTAIASLAVDEYEVYLASKSAPLYLLSARYSKFVFGPIGIIMGGADMLIHLGKSMDAAAANDPGATVGEGMMAVAGLLTLVTGVAEFGALVTGAEAAAWCGPVGWVASGILLGAALVLHYGSKNDLELYANHCFLGSEYGKGGTDNAGKPWLTGHGYQWLYGDALFKPASDRWHRQQVALIRLLCNFDVWTGATSSRRGGGYIGVGFVPGGATFEVHLELSEVDGGGRKWAYDAIVWPESRDWTWTGQAPADAAVTFFPVSGPAPVTSIGFFVEPGSDVRRITWRLCVRINLDNGANYVPPKGDKDYYVINDTTEGGIYNLTSSADDDKIRSLDGSKPTAQADAPTDGTALASNDDAGAPDDDAVPAAAAG